MRCSDDFGMILASLKASLRKNKIFEFLTFCSATNDKNDALRGSPAVTRLTVYRRLQYGEALLVRPTTTELSENFGKSFLKKLSFSHINIYF